MACACRTYTRIARDPATCTMERTTFNDLGLIEPILKALNEEGYTHPTPIQAQAIPHLIKGRDLLGCAPIGSAAGMNTCNAPFRIAVPRAPEMAPACTCTSSQA